MSRYLLSRAAHLTRCTSTPTATPTPALSLSLNFNFPTRFKSTKPPKLTKKAKAAAAAAAAAEAAKNPPPIDAPPTDWSLANEAAERLLTQFTEQKFVRRQILDANQLQKLSLTLLRPQLWPGMDIREKAPLDGTPLPPGYHLVYFTPGGMESELGLDGSDKLYNAPAPFSRRMWSGGKMRFDGELRVGDHVEEHTRLVSAEAKRSKDKSCMVVVGVEKQFFTRGEMVLEDRRDWVFRTEIPEPSEVADRTLAESVVTVQSSVEDEVKINESEVPTAAPRSTSTNDLDYPIRNLRWSPTGLFRFSALTFNAHKIHYDHAWTTAIEGHPSAVVHGPLNLMNMLDYFRDHICSPGFRAWECRYKILAPIYAGETYQIGAREFDDGVRMWGASVTGRGGTTSMRGDIWAKHI
ncbi:hypothetical protein GGR50DRAFT_693632 [Xylaria sp. CBS 124048]|nr:hypothetical protein GGR50DRAFT_693632 [Xylaria sp. CBS 124048]